MPNKTIDILPDLNDWACHKQAIYRLLIAGIH